MQPHSEFLRIKWLDDVVIGAGLQSLDDIALIVFACQQQNIGVAVAVALPQLSAKLDSIESGHHPIQNGKFRRIGTMQYLRCFEPVFGDDSVIPQRRTEDSMRRRETTSSSATRTFMISTPRDTSVKTDLQELKLSLQRGK